MFELTDKVALITGASGGIGGAIARALHSRGANVALTGTREPELNALATELGSRVAVVPCNVGDRDELDKLVGRVEDALGPLDILVNNAGITRDNLFIRISDEAWDDLIAINLTAPFRLTRSALRGMLKRRTGRIISVTSVVGHAGNPGQANYAAAKAGITGWTRSLAKEVANRNITVNCVAPGYVDTAMTSGLNDKQREVIMKDVPSGRLGKPEEVAAAVVFLASAEAAYLTGQTIHVNGGMHMP